MKQLFRIRKNKKGVSLIYVIIASAALLILGSVVAVSAMRNIDLTGNNHMSRYAYDRDKSAIEYAKGVLEQEYEADSTGGSKLKNFVVTNVKDGHGPYNCRFGDADIDGTNCFATCKITPDTSDSNKYTATITAGYPSSETDKKKLLKMKYTTHCTMGGGGIPYIQYGLNYGNHKNIVEGLQTPTILENTGGQGVSVYPVVFNLPVRVAAGTSNGILQAPQVFFMGGHSDGGSLNINGKEENDLCDAAVYAYCSEKATIKSDFIYVASDRINVKEGSGDCYLNISLLKKTTGYIYFANTNGCNIYKTAQPQGKLDGSEKSINKTSYKGLYSFSSEVNLFSPSCALTKVPDDNVQNILDSDNTNYIEKSYDKLAGSDANNSFTQPSEGGKADWTNNGAISGSAKPEGGYDVFFYATDASKWKDGDSPTYEASKISFMYVNETKNAITVGGCKTFNADAVSFCGQKQDGAGDSSDGLTLLQGNGGGQPGSFILKSESAGTVKVTVYHKLVIKKSGDSGYTVPAGTYTVPSETNLFDSKTTKDTFTPAGGGSSGGTGGGTAGGFSGGEYS